MGYTGLIAEIPIGVDGLTGTKNPSQAKPTELMVAQNLTFEAGTIQKEGGATKYNSTAITGTPAVIGGWDWFPSEGVQRMVVVTSDGRCLKDDGSGAFGTTLKSGLTVSDVVPVFVEGGLEAAGANRKLFLFTKKNQVQVLAADGATMADLATPPADWSGGSFPAFGFVHEGRLTGGGNSNDPHRWYYSMASNHENFTGSGSGSLSVFPGEGERLAGGVSFKGLAILWKAPRGVYAVDTSDTTIANWRVTRLTDAAGMLSPLGFALVDDDIIFMDQSGNFQALSAVQQFGDIASRNLGQLAQMAEFFRSTLSAAGLSDLRAIYYGAKRQLHVSVRQAGSSQNDARLVVDVNRPDRPRWHYSPRDVVRSLWLKKDTNGIPRPMAGDNAGVVWALDQTERSKAGAGYEGKFQSAQMDMSPLDVKFATIMKYGDFLELVVEPKGNWNLTVDTYWDGALQETLQFNMGTTGATLGSFVLDTDKLAEDQVLNRKKRITGGGRRFSLVGRNSGAGEDFSVARFYLHFRPGDERIP